MNDRLGRPLSVGDKVVFALTHYATLYVGTVNSFTPKRVRIEANRGRIKIVDPRQVARVDDGT